MLASAGKGDGVDSCGKKLYLVGQADSCDLGGADRGDDGNLTCYDTGDEFPICTDSDFQESFTSCLSEGDFVHFVVSCSIVD